MGLLELCEPDPDLRSEHLNERASTFPLESYLPLLFVHMPMDVLAGDHILLEERIEWI